MTPVPHAEPLADLVDFYRHLSPASLAQLPRFYASQARFKDPFNEVQGLPAIEQIFRHMFRALEQPRFEILRALADEAGAPRQAYITWVFHFRRSGRDFSICGVTEFDFDAAGRVSRHRDHWDAAGELYAKLPLIGPPMRWLARQLASPQPRASAPVTTAD